MSTLFNKNSQCIFWNNNKKAIQRMLDYDYICKRDTPSVVAIVHPTSSAPFQKFFFKQDEIIIPIYKTLTDAAAQHKYADIVLNFASFRTSYPVSMEALSLPSIKTIMITAEGVPERLTRLINVKAKELGKVIIGPATVGAITPGSFKTANIGGTITNIQSTKLNRPGSAGLVTRSGGLFNELANIISRSADGIAEGIAIGGDQFPGSSYLEHLLRMEKNPKIKYNVLLGEVGGTSEYEVIDAVKAGQLKKPIIGWCIGTVAEYFSGPIQFGHAGASANKNNETAKAKNKAMKDAGILVPKTFNELPKLIQKQFNKIASEIEFEDITEDVPRIPLDYAEAQKLGEIRKETNFICTISDDRGDEANYAGVPISSVATPETGYSIGDVISLLWFKKRFPTWASQFIETVIKTVADHGPAVSGAHNSRVASRAGKDVISSLASGLLTIGPRFGGAIDGAAKHFKHGNDNEMSAHDFVDYMKKEGIPIPGIGHRIKSLKNPDLRVKSLIEFAQEHFPSTNLLTFAQSVELITSSKKDNLILNVDGCIGVLMVDMWKSLNYTNSDIDDMIDSGTLNAFFVLGRSIGFIGHILDEKRLKMPLYRHEFDDILYDVETAAGVPS